MRKIVILLLSAMFALSLASCGVEIADTNGPDDISLVEITDQNILKMDIGAAGYGESTSGESKRTKYTGNSFSGVAEVYLTNYIGKSDVIIDVTDLEVESGNFRLVVLLNEEIIHEFKPGEQLQTLELEDIKGTLSIRMAGESAKFKFYMQIW